MGQGMRDMKVRGLIGVVGWGVLCVPAWASEPIAVRALAATCANCHGTDGVPLSGSSMPALAGRGSAELHAILTEYRNGTRPGTIMPQIAKGYTDAQLAALARYFSAQPRGAK